jgi:hypothetical protein
MIDPISKRKITEHAIAIDLILKNNRRTKDDLKCDICGGGDYVTKGGINLKVKNIVHGYEHRVESSPSLCYRHFNGWAHSYSKFTFGLDPHHGRTDQDIDLQFALYVASQLFKEANKEKQYAKIGTFGKLMLQKEREKTIGVT